MRIMDREIVIPMDFIKIVNFNFIFLYIPCITDTKLKIGWNYQLG